MKKTKFIAAALAVLFVFNAYAIPRSKAVVIDATAAFGAAAATAAINGTTATTLFTGMTTGAAQSAVITLMGEYAAATGAASSGAALAGTIGAGTIVTAAGAVVLTAAAGFAVYKFIEWLRDDKNIQPNAPVVSVFSRQGWLVDGIIFSTVSNDDWLGSSTQFELNRTYQTELGSFAFYYNYSDFVNGFYINGVRSQSAFITGAPVGYVLTSVNPDPDYMIPDTFILFSGEFPSTAKNVGSNSFNSGPLFSLDAKVNQDLSLASKPELLPIPEEIPDTDALVITSPSFQGLPQNDPQAVADAIFQSAIDGDLSPTVTVESDPTVTPEPEPGPTPPEDLPPNLPNLGETLTTRFPFSIPWDIGRVLDFLSADAVAPHIHFQPFKDDLFGLPADTVVIDYDFSRHEDIAAICRTFEIVGFCFLLAVGTKRLIWTA